MGEWRWGQWWGWAEMGVEWAGECPVCVVNVARGAEGPSMRTVVLPFAGIELTPQEKRIYCRWA